MEHLAPMWNPSADTKVSGQRHDPIPILAMAPNAWDGQWMNRQQLLSRLAARGTRVLYSTGQWASWHRREPAWRQAPAWGAFESCDGVWIDRAPRWLLRVPRSPAVNHLALRMGARRLRNFVLAGGDDFLLHVFHPLFQPYVEPLRPSRLIYHAYDLYERMPGWTRENENRERWLLQRADLRIASSRVTAERLEERGGKRVEILPNGVDFAAFRAAADDDVSPPDLDAVPWPRIGYVGSINRKVDLPLIAELAASHPQWHFVLVGAVGSLDEVTAVALDRCRQLPNVHELGWKLRDDVPAYVARLDVALMPYRVNCGLWSDATSPLKLHEYLAAGRSVVSSDVPALREFKEVIAIVETSAQWADAINRALDGESDRLPGRQAIAQGYDWSVQAEKLHEWLFARECKRRMG